MISMGCGDGMSCLSKEKSNLIGPIRSYLVCFCFSRSRKATWAAATETKGFFQFSLVFYAFLQKTIG